MGKKIKHSLRGLVKQEAMSESFLQQFVWTMSDTGPVTSQKKRLNVVAMEAGTRVVTKPLQTLSPNPVKTVSIFTRFPRTLQYIYANNVCTRSNVISK